MLIHVCVISTLQTQNWCSHDCARRAKRLPARFHNIEMDNALLSLHPVPYPCRQSCAYPLVWRSNVSIRHELTDVREAIMGLHVRDANGPKFTHMYVVYEYAVASLDPLIDCVNPDPLISCAYHVWWVTHHAHVGWREGTHAYDTCSDVRVDDMLLTLRSRAS